LSGGRPAYDLVSDSNLDWNQGFFDVENFVRQRGLTRVWIDEYGFSDPSVYVPEARFWNCQEAAPEDGGQWAIVSANMIEDSHDCVWLLRFLSNGEPDEEVISWLKQTKDLKIVRPGRNEPLDRAVIRQKALAEQYLKLMESGQRQGCVDALTKAPPELALHQIFKVRQEVKP
jgi:hypothetical protein